MEIHKVSVDAISAAGRLRSIDEQRVTALAESIKSIGLQTPVSAWANEDGSDVRLVAGAHRLAAVKLLGWEEVPCILVDMDEIGRRLWEIAENLHRAELSALERSEHIAEWVRLTEERRKAKEENQMAQVAPPEIGYKKPPPQKESGIRAASRELGIDRDKARRSVNIATRLSEEAKDVARETGLDNNQSALERAARADNQADELRRIAQEKAAARREEPRIEAVKAPEPAWTDEDRRALRDLECAWGNATAAAKRVFRNHLLTGGR